MSGRAGAKKANKVGVCVMCRKVFQCARSDKKTCTPTCRKAWQRYCDHQEWLKYKEGMKLDQSERLNALINNKFYPGHR